MNLTNAVKKALDMKKPKPFKIKGWDLLCPNCERKICRYDNFHFWDFKNGGRCRCRCGQLISGI